jgi:hypothetical protein
MPRALFSFSGTVSDLRIALIPAITRSEDREEDEIIEFLEDLNTETTYVPSYLEAQLA